MLFLQGSLGPFSGCLFSFHVVTLPLLSELVSLRTSWLKASTLSVALFSSSGTLWQLTTPRTRSLAPPTHCVVLRYCVACAPRPGSFTTTRCTHREGFLSGLWDSATAWSLRPSTPLCGRCSRCDTTVRFSIPVSLSHAASPSRARLKISACFFSVWSAELCHGMVS